MITIPEIWRKEKKEEISSRMEEVKKIEFHEEDKKKTVIRLGKGGGGIGVGLIFIGGALATAALVSALTVGRRLRNSNKSKSHDTSTASTEKIDKFIKENDKDESNGCSLPDSSPNIQQNPSNGTEKKCVIEKDHHVIPTQSFSLDEKSKLEINGGKGDLIHDDTEILLCSCPRGIESKTLSDWPDATNQEAFSFPVIEDPKSLQPANVTKNLHGGGIEMIKEDGAIEIAYIDQGTEDNQLTLANIKGEKRDIGCADDQEIGVKCQEAAEKAKADHSAPVMLQSSQESNLTDDPDQESNSTGNLLAEGAASEGQDFFGPVLENSTLGKDEKLTTDSEDGSLTFETIEDIEGDEAVEAPHGDKGKGSTMILMSEEEENKCNLHDCLETNETIVVVLKGDETLGAAHADQCKDNTARLMFGEEEKIWSQLEGSQTIETVEVLKKDETIEAEAAQTGQVKGSTITQTFEDQKSDQHDGLLTIETAQLLEEAKAIEPAQGKDIEPKNLTIEEENGAQHDDESGEAVERAEVVDLTASASDLQKQLIQEQETHPNNDQEDNSVLFCDGQTSEGNPYQNYAANMPNLSLPALAILSESEPDIGFNDSKEVHLSAEGCEIIKENVASEPVSEDRIVERDTPTLESTGKHLDDGNGENLEEVEGLSPKTDVENVLMDNNLITGMIEEDSVDDTEGDDDVEEATIADKVEESSEGTGDSSVESNTEPIWPAESLQELSMEVTEIKVTDQSEKQPTEEDQTILKQGKMDIKNVEDGDITSKSLQNVNDGKGNTKMTFLEKYMLELAEQNDQPTNSMKQRIHILMWTFLGVLWPLCFWRFGLPFFKISLIVSLVILLSKI